MTLNVAVVEAVAFRFGCYDGWWFTDKAKAGCLLGAGVILLSLERLLSKEVATERCPCGDGEALYRRKE